MRFAVIGAGVIGRTHAACIAELAPDATLALIADEVPSRARDLAAAYGAEAVTSAAAVFGRADIEAVAICTPSGRHAKHAVAALNAGKHAIVEKPIDVTLRAARRVAEAEARGAAIATVISQHRFDPSSQLVHRAISEGHFGRLTSAVASVAWWREQDYYDSGDWRGSWALDGGGALMNQGIHTADLLVWMMGEPIEVSARTACLAHQRIEVEDVAVAVIRFASGALGVLHATTAAYPGLTARIQVHGDRGSAVIDADRLSYFHAASGNAGSTDADAADLLKDQVQAPMAGSDPSAVSDAHLHQYRDFVEAIKQGRRPAVTVDDAIRALAVVEAVYESARTGETVPIEVPVRP